MLIGASVFNCFLLDVVSFIEGITYSVVLLYYIIGLSWLPVFHGIFWLGSLCSISWVKFHNCIAFCFLGLRLKYCGRF